MGLRSRASSSLAEAACGQRLGDLLGDGLGRGLCGSRLPAGRGEALEAALVAVGDLLVGLQHVHHLLLVQLERVRDQHQAFGREALDGIHDLAHELARQPHWVAQQRLAQVLAQLQGGGRQRHARRRRHRSRRRLLCLAVLLCSRGAEDGSEEAAGLLLRLCLLGPLLGRPLLPRRRGRVAPKVGQNPAAGGLFRGLLLLLLCLLVTFFLRGLLHFLLLVAGRLLLRFALLRFFSRCRSGLPPGSCLLFLPLLPLFLFLLQTLPLCLLLLLFLPLRLLLSGNPRRLFLLCLSLLA
mmetsp:Transcript_8059/g.33909  ORF Transcript_8059/g.33909 Transcript_8059/m.33909 type:complete len:295 (-) Transcript_8059:583-1467(-)